MRKSKLCIRSPDFACSWSGLGAMGDILHALPAVTALRQAHPSWQIGWVVEPRWQALLKAEIRGQGSGSSDRQGARNSSRDPRMPVVDRLHFAQTREWKRRPLSRETRSEISALRSELRAVGYDVVLDLQGAIRSAVIARLSGCSTPHRRGKAARVARALAFY